MMPSTKEKVWFEEFFKCGFNATEAARRACYAHPNKRGPEKLAKFRDEIAARLKEMAMGADEVLARQAEIARGAVGDYLTKDGFDLKRLVEDDKGYLVKKIYRTTRRQKDDIEIERVSVEVCDYQHALDLLTKHHGLLVERHEVTGADGGPINLVGIDPDHTKGGGD